MYPQKGNAPSRERSTTYRSPCRYLASRSFNKIRRRAGLNGAPLCRFVHVHDRVAPSYRINHSEKNARDLFIRGEKIYSGGRSHAEISNVLHERLLYWDFALIIAFMSIYSFGSRGIRKIYTANPCAFQVTWKNECDLCTMNDHRNLIVLIYLKLNLT